MPDRLIFAFDLGKASIGEAIRKGDDIIHAASLLIPEEFASTKEQAKRRRALRTRIAHKQREESLKKICREAGIEVLQERKFTDDKKLIPGDKRLEKEFPSKGEKICYTSCLLRIKLLRGEKLESWQIYKALHSAIQRRGYDPNPAWGSNNNKSEDEIENEKKLSGYYKDIELYIKDPARRYPCYYDAMRIGLWNPETDSLKDKIDCNAGRARGYVTPRKEVEKEFKELIEKASVFFPKLKEKADIIMHGPAGQAYASYYPELRQKFGLKRGADTDWLGVLSQKIPRFNNRCVGKCSLIPRLNVCDADDGLVKQVTFLMKLKNMRFTRNSKNDALSANELADAFAEAIEKTKSGTAEESSFKFTENQWKILCRKLDAIPIPGDKIDPFKASGRSRFSRPALRLMRELILSGKSPHFFREEKLKDLKTGKLKGLIAKDLDFLIKMPDDWNKIHIPSPGLEIYKKDNEDTEDAVKRLIASQNDPVVRHRLSLFSQRLDALVAKAGRKPDEVALEFVRSEFMGEEAKKRYESAIKRRREAREEAKKLADTMNLSGKDAILKAELYKQQNGFCVYSGEGIESIGFDNCQIDHIVPRRGKYNGSDSMTNMVLVKASANKDKGDRTPFEWLSASGRWEAFLEQINKIPEANMPRKKKLLLSSPEAQELDQKFTALVETAWISKLAQMLVHLKFGWPMGEEGSIRRTTVISGGLTAKVRRKYRLNQILYSDIPDDMDPDEFTKNREDKRHHALDAMVISYVPAWANDKEKRSFLKFPEKIHKNPLGYFREKIDQVVPSFICREKPVLEETFYAARKIDNEIKMVKRIEVAKMPFKGNTFDAKRGIKQAENILDKHIRQDIINFLTETSPDKSTWEKFLINYKSPTGSKLIKSAIAVGKPTEYKNLIKVSGSGKGQYKRPTKNNGYFVFFDKKGKPKVRPVYVFESARKIHKELIESGLSIYGFFQSNCLIQIDKDIDLGKRLIPRGIYLCSSIWSQGPVKLEGPQDYLKDTIGIEHLIKAGFRRVEQ